MSLLAAIRRMFAAPPRQVVVDVPLPLRVAAKYDAARVGGMNDNHWLAADALDADTANSLAVRKRLTQRSRYEVANNGHGKGITLTQAHYVVGRGPRLRMTTRDALFNAEVETAWKAWWKRIHGARKLRTAIKAKVSDGESFLLVVTNPALRGPLKLDLSAVECDQVSTPSLPPDPLRIDGIEFDEHGNPLWYDLLSAHPGSATGNPKGPVTRVAARWMLHLFREDRPRQHRGVPEFTSTLNLFAQGRRYREATLTSAENIAAISVLLKTQMAPNDGPDEIAAMSSLPFDKGLMTALPSGWDMEQPRAEQPTATYDSFTRSAICEEARPLSMPYNIAACDSSGYSFSGGRLDHLTYFVAVDVEQDDIEDMVLDPLLELWYEEAALVYRWPSLEGGDADAPVHTWVWPAKPKIDDAKTAAAREKALRFGGTTLRQLYAEDGLDFEDQLQALAEDYGVTVAEIRRILLHVNLGSQAPSAATNDEDGEGEDDDDPPPSRNGQARANGFYHRNGSR